MKKTLGGERLGSGKKMTVELPGFGRSTHNVGYLFKTDQAIATLVPYFCDIATNGTTYYMDIAVKDRTLPTASAPFASMKHQIDVFVIPIRLYISALHNNTLGIGLKMSQIKMPKMTIRANNIDFTKDGNPNAQQIAQDSLIAYLGKRGLGRTTGTQFIRKMPALFELAYYDIYKNYYSNKQEGVGVVITAGSAGENIDFVQYISLQNSFKISPGEIKQDDSIIKEATGEFWIQYKKQATREDFLNTQLITNTGVDTVRNLVNLSTVENVTEFAWKAVPSKNTTLNGGSTIFVTAKDDIKLDIFKLNVIDQAREAILSTKWTTEFDITKSAIGGQSPYTNLVKTASVPETYTNGSANYYSQNGLAIRTYLSDRFNCFLSKEWIEGQNGINEITAVDVSDGKLKIDALILQEKMFKMMNRIAISDGSFVAWQEAVYGMKALQMSESPIYVGGMSSEIVFGEIVSNSASGDEPLGTLAGKGLDVNKKGGKLKIKIKEPSMIMVIGSIVPRVDYSQGNAWWNELDSMDDLHKPSLDGIGFQDLITEEFAAFDTQVSATGTVTTRSIGKQPSWIQYMTNVNKSYGSFTAGGALSFMAPNREYHADEDGNVIDATTYIDPTIFNNLFADVSLSSKPIWVQAAFDVKARRVMSAKQIPAL